MTSINPAEPAPRAGEKGRVVFAGTDIDDSVADQRTASSSPLVDIATGRVRGTGTPGLNTFKGIPYAAPPIGELRFRAPRGVAPWEGEWDATALGHPSIQINVDLPPWQDPQPESEDCLVLNVWAPTRGSQARPVMVWIHGGYYWNGSAGAPMYDGANLALTGDVVVVSVNHRLNAFGYLWLGDLVPDLADGNVGQRDLVAALEWVRENIARFGGDPDCVTLFGESGGGGKISALLATPSARGLFHRAIVQSGSALRIQTREEATEFARRTLAALGDGPFDVARLHSISASELKAAAESVGESYAPYLDGTFLTHQTWQDGAPAESAGVPMMIGYTAHEMVVFQPDFADPIPDDAELERRVRSTTMIPELSGHQYRVLVKGHRDLQPDGDRHALLASMTSDLVFFPLARIQADVKAQQNDGQVFVYEFCWKTPFFGGEWASHAGELPLVFNNLSYGTAWDGHDSDAIRAAADPHNLQARLSVEMVAAWSAFARTGDPSTPSLPWPAWDGATRSTMVLDGDESTAQTGYADKRFTLVRDLPRSRAL